jgi:hypothetical protein
VIGEKVQSSGVFQTSDECADLVEIRSRVIYPDNERNPDPNLGTPLIESSKIVTDRRVRRAGVLSMPFLIYEFDVKEKEVNEREELDCELL